MGGIHGNETVGIDVLEAILEMINDSRLQVGTLNLIAGNPSALEQNIRFIEQDLNRCFGEMPKNPTLEHKRAAELKPILAKTGILLDIHSTMKPSKSIYCRSCSQSSCCCNSSILKYSNNCKRPGAFTT